MRSETSYSQSEYLSILTHAAPEAVKMLAETVIPYLGDIHVLTNRTGLVMLPFTDTATGARFHLGEVLVTEAHVQIEGNVEGYAVCTGRDLQFSLAVALLDAALSAGIQAEQIMNFVREQAHLQAETDDELLRFVEATRVEMETF